MGLFSRHVRSSASQPGDESLAAEQLMTLAKGRAEQLDAALGDSVPPPARASQAYRDELLLFAVAPVDFNLLITHSDRAPMLRATLLRAVGILCPTAPADLAKYLGDYHKLVQQGEGMRIGDIGAARLGLPDNAKVAFMLCGLYARALNTSLDTLQALGIAPPD